MSAARHLLDRMQADPRLAFLIGPGSQAYDLLTAEAAAASGSDVGDLRTQHRASLTYTPWPYPTTSTTASSIGASHQSAVSQLAEFLGLESEVILPGNARQVLQSFSTRTAGWRVFVDAAYVRHTPRADVDILRKRFELRELPDGGAPA